MKTPIEEPTSSGDGYPFKPSSVESDSPLKSSPAQLAREGLRRSTSQPPEEKDTTDAPGYKARPYGHRSQSQPETVSMMKDREQGDQQSTVLASSPRAPGRLKNSEDDPYKFILEMGSTLHEFELGLWAGAEGEEPVPVSRSEHSLLA